MKTAQRSWVLNPGSWVLGLGSWALGHGSLGPGSWVLDLGHGFWVMGPSWCWIMGPGCWCLGLGPGRLVLGRYPNNDMRSESRNTSSFGEREHLSVFANGLRPLFAFLTLRKTFIRNKTPTTRLDLNTNCGCVCVLLCVCFYQSKPRIAEAHKGPQEQVRQTQTIATQIYTNGLP